MLNSELYQKVQTTGEFIKGKLTKTPDIMMILGSGLGALADELTDSIVLDYSEIPNFPQSTIAGHAGQLVIGYLEDKYIVCMKGRFHYYEGYPMEMVTFPIRVMNYIGVKNLMLTNAAGAINVDFEPGDLMLIKDHLNVCGVNPLIGPNIDEMGERFPNCTDVYTKAIREQAKQIADKLEIKVQEGVYEYWTGPVYETPAEIRMFRILGADAIGMSTVPEALVAAHCKMNLLAVSCLTNMASGILDQPLSHKEVQEVATRVKDKFTKLIKGFVKDINW